MAASRNKTDSTDGVVVVYANPQNLRIKKDPTGPMPVRRPVGSSVVMNLVDLVHKVVTRFTEAHLSKSAKSANAFSI
jgi:hypothetical protein